MVIAAMKLKDIGKYRLAADRRPRHVERDDADPVVERPLRIPALEVPSPSVQDEVEALYHLYAFPVTDFYQYRYYTAIHHHRLNALHQKV